MALNKHMADLYTRLREVGFDRAFVLSSVLPDWWEDRLAENKTTRAIAEMLIARQLSFPLQDLGDRDKKLQRHLSEGTRLKKASQSGQDEVAPAVRVAYRVASLLQHAVKGVPAFQGLPTARTIRQAILGQTAFVDLESLLSFAWTTGIPVAHIARLPKLSKKIAGLAACFEKRPVIVLASGYDAPARLLFHLAHELGHIAMKHIEIGDATVDIDIGQSETSTEEQEADRFATELLTGDPETRLAPVRYGLNATQLAHAVISFGNEHRIDPCVAALNYGWAQDRFPVAAAALRILQQHVGGKAVVSSALKAHLDTGGLSEDNVQFLTGVASIAE
jgi:hypothetical protein